MSRRFSVTLAAALALAALAATAPAQEPPRPVEAPKPDEAPPKAERRSRGPSATLRIDVVLARFQGERKIASLPYSMLVTAGGMKLRMRMGVDTPIPVTSYTTVEGEGPKPSTTYQYRTIGTNLDCVAHDVGDGRYELVLSVENSSALAGPGSQTEGRPLFRRFETTLGPVLRDGQTVQTIASTDPVTGEVVKIDVTLNVVR